MKKLERYEYNCMGEFCDAQDVAELEAQHAEMLAAAKGMVAWWDRASGYPYQAIENLRAAIAKAEGEVMS